MIDNLWRTVGCTKGRGHGFKSASSGGGSDFKDECHLCEGRGYLFILPNGRVFQYPDGPVVGLWPHAYEASYPWSEDESSNL